MIICIAKLNIISIYGCEMDRVMVSFLIDCLMILARGVSKNSLLVMSVT